MAKGLNQVDVSMRFTADTSEAKRQLNELQASLSNLTKNPQMQSGNLGMTKEISQAIVKTTELQAMLESCKTSAGTLDLGKFTQSLKNNQTSIRDYAKSLQSLGPAGEQAFSQLARSITQAEVPLKRSSGLLQEFATTLKNTARWQISSSILHGFMGAVQSAYGYAQDLNESLNNIRIVTGYNTEQMSKFANQANKAAKALSATTTDYTNASLIYYQQGLSDSEVKERTDITIKMANVAGQSAETVSDQMTAVWNNFDDGSKSLEYYADVMTALGAATASSTDEIAAGLEKFSAVADTVGLSYEYATAALATVTAETRQSADVVGTAFKTLFARIEGLKLGGTLEDGTDLNKYSAALQKVGVDIKDASGQLRDMDDILDDLGERWQTLAKDEQVALAQTVAGVRQYNQLISLMDNWDTFQENLGTAYGSSGALEEQAEIYAESWEAARDRVQASLETIYQQLLKDEFFIDLTDGFGKFLDVLSKTIDGLGGLPGVLAVISSLMFKIFGADMIKQMEQWKYNFQLRSDDGIEEILQKRKAANEELRKMFANSADDQVGTAKADVYTKQANLQDTLIVKQQELLAKGTQLTEEEQRQANLLLDINAQMGQRAIKAAEDLASQEKINRSLEDQAKIQIKVASRNHSNNAYNTFERDLKVVKELQVEYGTLQTISGKITKNSNFDEIKQSLVEMSKAADKAGISFERIDEILAQVNNGAITDIETLSNAIETAMLDIGADGQMMFDTISSKAEQAGVNMKEFTPILDKMRISFAQTGSLTAEQIQILKDYGINVDEVTNKLLNMKGTIPGVAEGIVALGHTLSNVAMLVTSIKGFFDIWNNEDMTFGEQLISMFTTLGMVVPMVTASFNKQNLAQLSTASSAIAAAVGAKTATFAIGAQGAITNVATGETVAFGTALWTVLWPIGLVMAAIIGLIAVIGYFVNKTDESTKNLEKLNESLQIFTEQASAANTEAENLKNTIESYNKAVDTLQDLKRAGEDVTQAFADANKQARDLVKEYPQLLEYANLYNEDGTLNKDVLYEFNLEMQRAAEMADRIVINTQMRKKQAELEVSKENFAEKTTAWDNVEYTYTVKNPVTGKASGAMNDSFALNFSEEVIKHLDDWADLSADEFAEKAGEFFDAQYDESGNTTLNDEAYTDQKNSFIEAAKGYQDSINSLATETDGVAVALKNAANEIRNIKFGSATDSDTAEKWQEKYEEVSEDTYDEWTKKLTGDGINASSNEDNSTIVSNMLTEFTKIEGYEGYDLQSNGVRGTDNNREFYFYDAQGKEAKFTAEQMAAIIAEAKATEAADNAVLTGTGNDTVQTKLDNAGLDVKVTEQDAGTMTKLAETLDLVNSYNKGKSDEDKIDTSSFIEEVNALESPAEQAAKIKEFVEKISSATIDGVLDPEALEDKEVESIAKSAVSEELIESTEAFEAYRDAMIDATTQEKLGKKASAELAKQMLKNQKSFNKAAEGLEEYNEALKNKDEVAKANALGKMASALNEVFGEDVWDGKKIEKHKDIVERALKGEASAFNELQTISAKEIIGEFGEIPDELSSILTEIANLDSVDVGEKVTIGEDPIASKLQSMYYEAAQAALDGGKSVEEAMKIANDAINAVGYEAPEIEMEEREVWVTTELPVGAVPQADGTFVGPEGEVLTGYKWTDKQPDPATATHKVKMLVPKSTKGDSPLSFTKTSEKIGPTSSGSGGGGSKSKPAEKVKKTKKSDVVERYKEINDALDDMADALDKASGKADRLYGKARIKAMKDQAKLMRDEINLLKKKRDEAKKYEDQDKKALNKKAAEYGIKFSYDDNGNITDYTSEMEKLYKELNAAETKMDGMSTKEAQDEYKEKTVQPIQDKIDELTELIEQYEETRELLEDLDKDIREKEWAEEDLEFETFEYEIELKLEVDTRELEYLEYLLSEIEDAAFKSADRLNKLFKQQEPLQRQINNTTEAMVQVLRDNGLTDKEIEKFKNGKAGEIDFSKYAENFTPEEIEFLKNSADELLAYNQSLVELQDNIHNEVNVAYDEWNEKLSKQISLYEHYDSIIDNLQTLGELAGGYATPGMKTMFADAKVSSSQGMLEMRQKEYATQQANLEEARKKLSEATTEADIERWTKTVEAMEEKVIEAEENMYAAAIAAAEAAQEQFNVAIDNAIDKYNRSLSANGKSLEAVAETMERQQTINEQYLNDYQKAYEITKLTRDINKSIDETDNLKAKEALRDLQEEINEYQKEGNEMSRYDIDYLQKKYELRLAEIALEEAQNAKSQVRMSRDSEGNWGYVYAADEDKVAEAEQNYADKLYEMQEMSNNYANEMSQSLIQTEQEFADTMAQIQQNWQEGRYASYEEYQQAMNDATAYYTERINYFSSELDGVTQNNKELYENDWQRFEEITGYKIGKEEDFQTCIADTLLGMATGYTDAQQPMDAFVAAVGNPDDGTGMLGAINTAFTNWKTNTDTALGGVGLSLEGLAGGMAEQIGTTGEDGTGILGSLYDVKSEFETDAEAMEGYMSDLMDKVSEWQKKHSEELQAIIDKNKLVVESFNDLNNALIQGEEEEEDGDDESPQNETPQKETPTTETPKEITTGGQINAGSAKIYDYKGDTSGEGQYYSSDPKYNVLEVSGNWIKVRHHKLSSGVTGWFKKGDVTALDTGGYTGQWGAEGKLAFLHQKELVLNPGETENFLLAMNVLREIVKGVTLTSMFNDSLYSVSPGVNDFDNKLEQEVTIHAEFPNVTDHNEIEEALNNLVNTASQYANRKK